MARITDFCCKTAYQNLSKFFCFRSIVRCFQRFVRGSSPFGKVVSHEPPLLLGNYCLWPPPLPRNFHWSSVAGVWIFSGNTHSSKNPHKRQYQEKKTIPANMYNHFHIKLASYWTRTGSTCTCILCYFSIILDVGWEKYRKKNVNPIWNQAVIPLCNSPPFKFSHTHKVDWLGKGVALIQKG